ncbi:MAG: hypothetical protein ABI137_08210 [Antricoccus sp.]
MTIRVLHLVGSAVSEFYADLSLLYARGAFTATADVDKYRFEIAYVSPDGRWRFPADLSPEALEASAPMSLAEAIAKILVLKVEVMIPQMFCLPGMTSYRALFDVIGIPFVGNAPDVMALGAHKGRAKAVVAAAGVAVPAGRVVSPGVAVDAAMPAIVKPADADNSLGLTLVREERDLDAALAEAFVHSPQAIVEAYIELGREVRCGIIERDGELLGLPLEEYRVDPVGKPIRPHDDKIRRGDKGDLALVAKDVDHAWIVDVDDPITAVVWEAARRCHIALGCRDYSLFDFRIDPEGRPWFLEASLYNSFAPSSVLAMMAAAAGISLESLFADCVQRALTRLPDRTQIESPLVQDVSA